MLTYTDFLRELREYLRELLETMLGVALVMHLNPKLKVETRNVLYLTWVIGSVTYGLKQYDDDLFKAMKNGMYYALSSNWF